MTGAVFVDRDGTLCEHVPYLSSPDRVELLPTVASGVRALNAAGVPVVVVTNQSGIGRGYFDRADAERVNEALRGALEREDAAVDDVYLCPHHPDDGCECRKPEPGMLREAAAAHDVDLESSYLVGDRQSDVEAGRRVGCTTVLFPSEETRVDPAEAGADHVVERFSESTDVALADLPR